MEQDYGDVTVDSQGKVWTVKAGVGALTYVDATGGDHNASVGEVIEYTAGSNIVRFPTAVGKEGKQIKVTNTGTGVITLDASGAETVAGDPTFDIYQDESLELTSNGTNWII